jgi:hypothetical protein
LPVQIGIFEDPTVVDKSKELQQNSTLLSSILGQVVEVSTNPTFKNVLGKYAEVERELGNKEIGERTKALFKKLDEAEKTFLRTQNAIQSSPIGEFAIKVNYYTNTLAVLAKSEDNE